MTNSQQNLDFFLKHENGYCGKRDGKDAIRCNFDTKYNERAILTAVKKSSEDSFCIKRGGENSYLQGPDDYGILKFGNEQQTCAHFKFTTDGTLQLKSNDGNDKFCKIEDDKIKCIAENADDSSFTYMPIQVFNGLSPDLFEQFPSQQQENSVETEPAVAEPAVAEPEAKVVAGPEAKVVEPENLIPNQIKVLAKPADIEDAKMVCEKREDKFYCSYKGQDLTFHHQEEGENSYCIFNNDDNDDNDYKHARLDNSGYVYFPESDNKECTKFRMDTIINDHPVLQQKSANIAIKDRNNDDNTNVLCYMEPLDNGSDTYYMKCDTDFESHDRLFVINNDQIKPLNQSNNTVSQ